MVSTQVIADLQKWGLDPRKIPAPIRNSKEPITRLFSYHDAHPITFSMVLMEKFDSDWIEWEPETLRSEILTVFKANSISEHSWQKIQAIRTLFTTVGFWEEWHIFEKIIQALNNNIPTFDKGQKCSLAQLMAGVDMVSQIRNEDFSGEIQRYTAACAIDEGVTYLPPPLDFAQTPLSEPKYHCLDCGSVAYDDLTDSRCDYCVARFRDGHPFNKKPAAGIPDSRGRNIRRYLMRDPGPAKERFEEVLEKGENNVELSDLVAEDVQAAKLMVAVEYMELRRSQLVEQLEEIKTWVTH